MCGLVGRAMVASGDVAKVACEERLAAVELLDVFHEFRKMKQSSECLDTRNKFLECLNSFKKYNSEEIKAISVIVKRHLERFEPVIDKNIMIEMRVFARKHNYYSGFEVLGTCRRSKMPRLV